LRRIDKVAEEGDVDSTSGRAVFADGEPADAFEELDLRSEPVRLVFSVEPAEAALYLDGHFLGTAAELGHLNGVLIDVGFHQVEIVHPSFVDQVLEFTAESGEEIEMVRRLEPTED
jgi:hypothetical protein